MMANNTSLRTPYWIAVICCLLPLISVHLTAVISMLSGNIKVCLPYWSDCYSISATGRAYPEFFFFKGLLIPSAVFMLAYWLLLHRWVQMLSHNKLTPTPVTVMGIIAALALILYTVTLGASGDSYELARRIGIIFYFAFTVFGHLVLLSYLDKLDTEAMGIVREQNRLIITSLILLGSAIMSAFIGLLFDAFWDRWENAYEWWFSLLMISAFYQVACMWRKTNYQLGLTIFEN